MDYGKATQEELIRTVKKQEKIIQGFLGISWFYSVVKRIPLVGGFFRYLAGILKSGNATSLKIINNVKSEKPEIIAVCSPHPLNRGVRSATYAICPDVVEVSEIFSRSGARKVARVIGNLGPKKVLLSGYPLGYELLAEELRQNFPEIRVFAYIHSSFTWLGIDIYQAENPVLERIINLSKEGVIEKVGFCKRDLAEYFKEQGVNSFFVMNRFEIPKKAFKPLSQEKIKIGVFGHSWWHRNILNQVIAALMIPNSEIHVNEIGDFDFVDEKRVVVHGFLPKAEFNKVMAEMDLNLYVSFTDCFPMTLIESMELGIPAIASDTSDVYSFDKKIKDRLVVSTIDGPLGIKEKIEEVIKDYDQIQKMITDYLPLLKEKVEKSISDFLK